MSCFSLSYGLNYFLSWHTHKHIYTHCGPLTNLVVQRCCFSNSPMGCVTQLGRAGIFVSLWKRKTGDVVMSMYEEHVAGEPHPLFACLFPCECARVGNYLTIYPSITPIKKAHHFQTNVPSRTPLGTPLEGNNTNPP